MSATINTRIQLKRDTTYHWNSALGFIPLEGEVIIYTDYQVIQKNGTEIKVPGIKIGDGRTYIQDLPFVDGEMRQEILSHINDNERHVTTEEKKFWSNKLNLDDNEVVEKTLIFNRM